MQRAGHGLPLQLSRADVATGRTDRVGRVLDAAHRGGRVAGHIGDRAHDHVGACRQTSIALGTRDSGGRVQLAEEQGHAAKGEAAKGES
ncbi:MAG: hypothetical protein ACK56F_18135, partial [bacterium]